MSVFLIRSDIWLKSGYLSGKKCFLLSGWDPNFLLASPSLHSSQSPPGKQCRRPPRTASSRTNRSWRGLSTTSPTSETQSCGSTTCKVIRRSLAPLGLFVGKTQLWICMSFETSLQFYVFAWSYFHMERHERHELDHMTIVLHRNDSCFSLL